ncbi:RNA polymerase sigma factor [Microbacterium ulmi]|uniref:RNA polymerase sigma factor n=1 Tax=Microbacterium ulmi TaxID=179095 RepID=A0A7Y2PYR7_9MICO|nr:RNA polymerase sigma factor [Microbacterium ulmi]NII71238.1 RNA polymerase sigma-70 factor (ECF subfamily) [Microbacterium ulmi]NNH02543.1 RNA polymerase sigma factor [Microbacterium ulmi]
MRAQGAADRLTTALTEASPSLLAYLQRRVGFDDAPDLLGETMVVAWRRVGDLPADPERARMWLFGIARGTLLNHARGERRRWALADRIRGHAGADAAAPAADEGSEVRDAIARLDADLAELVRLVHWERFSLVEAAEVLGIPASTARGRYARAKDELRAALGVEVR